MKRVYITFGGKAYDETTERIVKDALEFNADEVLVYDDSWLMEQPFYHLNRWIFDREPKFGFGWCCWKPFIILDAMRRQQAGDVVLYTDADTYPIADLDPIFDHARARSVMLFESQGNPNLRFTKRDAFIVMNADYPAAHQARHACGRFQAFAVGQYTNYQFLVEWLTYSLNPLCQFRDRDGGPPSIIAPDYPEYFQNSAEQSVLTILAHKYSIPLHREACQFGWPPQPGYEDDTYPQLFHQQYCEGDRSDVSGSRFRNV